MNQPLVLVTLQEGRIQFNNKKKIIFPWRISDLLIYKNMIFVLFGVINHHYFFQPKENEIRFYENKIESIDELKKLGEQVRNAYTLHFDLIKKDYVAPTENINEIKKNYIIEDVIVFNKDGEMVWRFGDDREVEEKRLSRKLPLSFGFDNSSVYVKNNKLYIYNFQGYEYELDYKTGRVLDIKFMK